MSSLESRITAHFDLPGIDYVPEDYFEYVDHNSIESREMKRELAAIALSAARAGELGGALGLEYIQNDMFFDMFPELGIRPSTEIAYHGSPYELTVIKPRQATWTPRRPASYRFADGEPAICASPKPTFPAVRSLLHEQHPEIAAQALVLRKATDRFGKVSWVTSEEALEALKAAGTTGNVYAVMVNDKHDDKPASYDWARAEYRLYGERVQLARVPVVVDDLPPDLCVIPAGDQGKLSNVHLYDNILAWGEGEHVPVRPLGGLWPKEYFS